MSAQGVGENRVPPVFRMSAFLLIAISMSLGWGIRGNFGHEYGAMIPGALGAMAGCLLSGREDWRRRVAYFGMFGALGWGFGATISYMQVISYTHSGHFASQLYGFAALLLVGFLWAALGGAGTALPAVFSRERLTALFRPLCWVFAFWAVLAIFGERLVEQWASGSRHESPLYWFDADWLQAVTALIALCLFDLWDRRFGKIHWLIACAAAGGLVGFGTHFAIEAAGLTEPLAQVLIRRLGDTALYEPERLMINWPQCLPEVAQALGLGFGALIGALLGIGAYFFLFGKWRSGSSLFVHMAVGWLIGFILLPTLLGVRLTPPRSDDWAGILGLFCGASIYFLRNNAAAVFHASIVAGLFGGVGFSGAAWLKLMMVAPGNPVIAESQRSLRAWAHWQSANWHSFLEQSYGFVNGLGIAMMLGLLAARVRPASRQVERRPWTQGFAVAFVGLAILFLNMRKNVRVWVEAGAMPRLMKAPLFESLLFSAHTWFHLVWALLAAAFIALLIVHQRRRIALVPATWLGKGQLLFLVLLWPLVIANFERALVGFTEQRLLTEGVIMVNAIIATVLVLYVPQESEPFPSWPVESYRSIIGRTVLAGLVGSLTLILAETATVRMVYGDKFAGHAGYRGQPQMRFGPDAEWRIRPNLRGEEHR